MRSDPPRRRRRADLAFAIAAAALIAAACGGNASPSPNPESTALPSQTTDSSPGPVELRIPLPDGWHQIELTEAALQAQIDAFAESNPELAEPLRQLLSSGAFRSLSFYAIGYAVGYNGLVPIGNVNAVSFPMPGLDIDALEPLVVGQLEQIGAIDIQVGDRSVLGTDGLVVDYRLPVEVDGASPSLTSRVFVAIIDGTAWDVTVTCTAADPAPCLDDADAMADGMTLGAP
jgi:hypothetical protein